MSWVCDGKPRGAVVTCRFSAVPEGPLSGTKDPVEPVGLSGNMLGAEEIG